MKAVLISIQPKWCELIASGKKTIEVRKTRPKIETPFKCYIYCTKGKPFIQKIRFGDIAISHTQISKNLYNGKVIGEFVCDDIIVDERGENADVFSKYAQLSLVEQKKYGANKPLFGWHISKLKIYYKPKELGEFRKEGFMTEEQWLYALYPNTHCHYAAWAKRFEITRPPQSWCYVEELL